MTPDTWLGQRSKATILLLGTLCVVTVGVADYVTTYELSLAVFYMAPIMAASWYAGRWVGIALSLESAVVSIATDLWGGVQYSSFMFHAWNGVMRLVFFATAAFLLDSLRRSLARERGLARRDALTGLANRLAFYEVAKAELARSARHERPLTLVYIDCDRFKEVNDTRGHAEGDRVLKAVGSALSNAIRKTDLTARLGGDEFAVLYPELDAARTQEVVNKLQSQLGAAMRDGGWPVTFSIGVVTCERVPASVEELIHRADQLMYEVKSSGRDAVRFARFPEDRLRAAAD